MFPVIILSGTDWLVSSKHYEASPLHSHSLSNQCKLSCTSPYIQYTIGWSSPLSHSYWAQTFNFDTLRAQGPCTWAAGDYKHVCLATRGKKNKKEIYTTEHSACLFWGFFDMITVMLLNIISSSHGLLGTVHMCICKHVSSLGAYSWVRLSKAEWLSNEINTPEETERVMRWMKKISTEALKK